MQKGGMSVWAWILIGTVGVLAVALVTSLAVAAMLATIGREASELIEFESHASPPLTRAIEPAADDAEQRVTGHRARGW